MLAEYRMGDPVASGLMGWRGSKCGLVFNRAT